MCLVSALQVVMQLVRLLPDGHRMKREVDMALDCVSETMTPMHYHLREIIISTYRQVLRFFTPLPEMHLIPLGTEEVLIVLDLFKVSADYRLCFVLRLAHFGRDMSATQMSSEVLTEMSL